MGVNFGTLLYQIALRRTQNSHDWEASKAADRLFSLPQKVELCKGWVMKPQNQFPLAGGTVAGFASSAFSCSLFNICKTQSTYISPIDTGVLNEEREREREREYYLCQERACHLIIDQVVECDDTSDERRKIYYQHHIVCFNCTKGKERFKEKIKRKTICTDYPHVPA